LLEYWLELCEVPSEVSELVRRVGSGELAVVKPNICGLYPPSASLLRAVIAELAGRFRRVLVGDSKSTMYEPLKRMKALGYLELVSELGAEAVDLTELNVVKVPVPKPHALKAVKLSQLIIEADALVNVAKLGPHPSTRITAALKNLFGLIAEKYKLLKYHPLGVDKVIADIAQVANPRLNIVEVKGLIVVSDSPLAADVASALLSGYDPRSVKHLRLVAEDLGVSLESLVQDVKRRLNL